MARFFFPHQPRFRLRRLPRSHKPPIPSASSQAAAEEPRAEAGVPRVDMEIVSRVLDGHASETLGGHPRSALAAVVVGCSVGGGPVFRLLCDEVLF